MDNLKVTATKKLLYAENVFVQFCGNFISILAKKVFVINLDNYLWLDRKET